MHVPAGLIFKIGAAGVRAVRTSTNFVRRLMFRPTLAAAHLAWLRHHALGSEWEDIGEGIEVSMALARLPEGPASSTLALRCLTKEYESAIVVVEAVVGSIYNEDRVAKIYDDTRMVSGLNRHMRVVTLSGIPPYETIYVKLGGYWKSSYSQYRVRITSLTENGVCRASRLETHWADPIDQTMVQPHLWKLIGHDLYHIGEIVWAKEAIQRKLYVRFGGGRFARIISGRAIAAFLFWTPLVLRFSKFKPTEFADSAKRRQARYTVDKLREREVPPQR